MESLSNPIQRVIKPKIPNGRTRRLELDEEQRLLDACDKNFRQVVLFALETAMRREEISLMEWRHINLKKHSVFLPETKNGESRTVPLSGKAISVLNAIQRNITGSVFGMTKDQITRNMRIARRKAGIEDLRFHDLRHEATSRFFEDTDLDTMEIQAITGHKTMQMLKRYSHLKTSNLVRKLLKNKK